MLKSVSKVALAVTCLTGGIYVDADSSNQIHQDSTLNFISTGLQGGWNWGMSKAEALCDNSCGWVEGTTSYPNSGSSNFDPNDFDNYIGDSGNDSDSGNDNESSSSSPDNSVETAKQYTKCLQEANGAHSNCLTNTTAIDIAYAGCVAGAAEVGGDVSEMAKKGRGGVIAGLGGLATTATLTYLCESGKKESLAELPGVCAGRKLADQAKCESRYG